MVGGSLWGLMRTVGAELPLFYGGMVDIDPTPTTTRQRSSTCSVGSGDETWLARRARRDARRPPARLPAGAGPRRRVATDGAYLVTGGFGALGLATAHGRWSSAGPGG